jgi:cation diffusion facilitator CzcD-associated flavoprotein CzcO
VVEHKNTDPDYDVIIIGAGVCGIYQLYRLLELGLNVTVLEKGDALGGTWYWNRYPGARFDSESYGYGYSFSKEVLAEWNWTERFAGQPETLRYLEYVADKFDLREHMQFGCLVESQHFDDEATMWRLRLGDGRELSSRFVIMSVGLLSAPTMPRYPGMDSFRGQSFHTFDWPAEPVDFAGRRVAVIGTGATGVQLIAAIADRAGELTVFQRHPNWCAPLNNSPISAAEMDDIKTRYDEIFEFAARTAAGHLHEPDPRSFHEISLAEARAKWEQLYHEPGFGIWLANFRDVYIDEAANAALSDFIAEQIRRRVHDPRVADLLIPKDHGFGTKRVPLETRYYEAYNRDSVHLVDLLATPIESITPAGVRTTDTEYPCDIIVYATGFDAVTGAYDRIDIRGVGGARLRDKWAGTPHTYLGLLTSGFPNMFMPTGPQSGSASSNFPRGIEMGVDWITGLIAAMRENGQIRAEATPEAEAEWSARVIGYYEKLLMRNAKSWFTGYNSNVEGHSGEQIRYVVYNGSSPGYRKRITKVADDGYPGIDIR